MTDTESTRSLKNRHDDYLESLLGDSIHLYHTPDKCPFASVESGGRRKVFPLNSKEFKGHLKTEYYRENKCYPNPKHFQDFLNILSYRALEESPEAKLHIRLAAVDDVIYLDLGDPKCRAVKITKSGWKIVVRPNVFFFRPTGFAALPRPKKADTRNVLKKLRKFFNTTPTEQTLIIAWLIGSLLGTGPYPILIFQGEPGSGKSTASKLIKSLIDPSVAAIKGPPKNDHDLMIMARNSHILAFDNISGITRTLSDSLCRLSTGGGWSTRQLYSDADEVLFDAVKPQILNGIGNIAVREDLADRALSVELMKFERGSTRREHDLIEEFDESKPAFLGALLSAVSMALSKRDKFEIDAYPRMADFVHFIVASEKAVFKTKGTFLKAIRANSKAISKETIEYDSFASALTRFIRSQNGLWQGTAGDLLSEIQNSMSNDERDKVAKDKSWPKATNFLSTRLKELAPALRKVGYEVERDRRTSKKRLWTLTFVNRKEKKQASKNS
ncbi:MAG: hypothetical protein AB2L22_09710 [Syntrophales bacterium]